MKKLTKLRLKILGIRVSFYIFILLFHIGMSTFYNDVIPNDTYYLYAIGVQILMITPSFAYMLYYTSIEQYEKKLKTELFEEKEAIRVATLRRENTHATLRRMAARQLEKCNNTSN